MRFDYLNLRAFGHFTDYELLFDPSKNFHILYGPNEAGKSTTLRSITHFLYGFPQKTNDAFLHGNSKLRIEGQLRNSKGEAVQFIRRKGRKDTVLDLDGNPIPEKTVAAFLHDIPESQFLNMFALDHVRLREGGESLLQSGGSAGESFFSAASGINVLRSILENFEKQAGALYKKTGSVPELNKLLKREKELTKKINEQQLKVRSWNDFEERYREAEKEINTTIERMKTLRSKKEQLQRVKWILPKIAKREDLKQKLAALGTVPDLPEDISDVRMAAENKWNAAKASKEKIEQQLAEIEAEIKQISIPEKILEQAETIHALYREVQAYQNHEKALPELEGKKQQLEAQLISAMKEIDPARAALENIDDYRLTSVKKEMIRGLCKEKPLLDQKYETLQRESEKSEKELAQKLEELAAMPDLPGAGELEALLNQVNRAGNLEDALKELYADCRQKEQQIEEEIRLLPLWDGGAEELVKLPVPVLAETVKRFEKEEDGLRRELELVQSKIRQLEEEIEASEERIRKLDSLAEIPSEEKLLAARAVRDTGWRLIRAKLETGKWNERLEEYTKGKPIESLYETHVRDADRIADTLRMEAEKVGEKNKLLADIEKCREKIDALKAEKSRLEESLQAWKAEWHKLWAPAQITPLSPAEMREWLQKHAQIKGLVQEYEKTLGKIRELENSRNRSRNALSAVLKAFTEVSESQPLVELVSLAEKQLKQIRGHASKKDSLEAAIQGLKVKVEENAAEKTDVEKKRAEWFGQWVRAVEGTAIAKDAPPTVAETLLGQYETCARIYDAFKQAEKEQLSISKQMELFEEKVQHMLQDANLGFNGENAGMAVAEMYRILQKAQQDEVELKNCKRQLDNLLRQKKEEADAMEEAAAVLKGLFHQAGCGSIEELKQIEKTFLKKKEYETGIQQIEAEILDAGGGRSLQELVDEAARIDTDRIDADLDETERELEQLELVRSQVEQEYGAVKKEYEKKIQGANLATVEAEQEKESIHAKIASLTEQYIQVKLASALLQKGIEFYRSQNQNPVLRRASEIFAQLTLRSFAGLTVDYNEQDEPVLMGVRENGEKVPVSGMSDGTTDQLYLSLRLASIEKFAAENEPLPFIVDDILVHFDDERSKETLKVLLELSAHTQIIFFTHHERLVDMMNEIASQEAVQFLALHGREAVLH
ncbi:AAA family ATPase [Heyndrickxia coagulans]|uniref:AAA family ATPase n=1 Tax=Heyndrickxia coagulans TaxID=1398 RepID=UPI0028F7D210|nr:AAA family ATPase [Heyndrickxia coagulans]MDT9756866.1 AAA family ATPase [Heyndrickxia coagulans]